nr:uncharacterized protein LOC112776643 [Arachis hypogaea]
MDKELCRTARAKRKEFLIQNRAKQFSIKGQIGAARRPALKDISSSLNVIRPMIFGSNSSSKQDNQDLRCKRARIGDLFFRDGNVQSSNSTSKGHHDQTQNYVSKKADDLHVGLTMQSTLTAITAQEPIHPKNIFPIHSQTNDCLSNRNSSILEEDPLLTADETLNNGAVNVTDMLLEGIGEETACNNSVYTEEYINHGECIYECEFCNALFWYDERIGKHYNATIPKYTLCCRGGQVQLPQPKEPPLILQRLMWNNDDRSKNFCENLRTYNSMFAFTSLGGKVDKVINRGRGPPTFILCGQNYHLLGSLIPPEGSTAKFAQLYIYDTDNEISNRIQVVSDSILDSGNDHRSKVDMLIVQELKEMLDKNNVLVKSFRMVRDSLNNGTQKNVKLRLIGKRGRDGRRYNLPSVSEVAGLIVGDFDASRTERDIVVQTRSGSLQRITELNPSYLGLQYPILFPYGEDGFREHIPLNRIKRKNDNEEKCVTMRDYFAFYIQERFSDGSPLLYSRRLFQQFIVDAYSMIESSRLNYYRFHQENVRCDLYKGICEAVVNGDNSATTHGRRIVLPATFVGGPRYMIQNYQDAMAICTKVGYPDLFLTFTCNPKWPEIVDHLSTRGLKAEDRPDIVCRMFKMKLDTLIKDLRVNMLFGRVVAVVYTIEFQKRGLPHVHILLFLHEGDKYPTPDDIDNIISAEIPDKSVDAKYYDAVSNLMIHGPCGASLKDSPCMDNGRCLRNFPKRFVDSTSIDDDGYPVYRRRDTGRTIKKSGVELDNRWVVPHNRSLLLKYGAHINVEWCNQSRSIKYLFKYVNKGHDRVTASFYREGSTESLCDEIDEIKMYYDCRYLSPCEAAWRIMGYDIHYRYPAVIRLPFHLPSEQIVLFKDHESLKDVVERPTINQSMFLAWFEANREFEEAKQLSYVDFPSKFVWNANSKKWHRRRSHHVIGRVYFVPPSSGESYYLRILLNLVKGPTSYEDIRTYNGVVYKSFREACFARGLLDDDREYIEAIEEASIWGSGEYLRNLFATLLFSNSMTRPLYVWEKTWKILSDGILHNRRRLLNHPGLTISDNELLNLTLIEVETILKRNNRSLMDYPDMHFPNINYEDGMSCDLSNNNLINDELLYDRQDLGSKYLLNLAKMTTEQKNVYDTIINSVDRGEGGLYFLYGYGGTGKTFIWQTLAASLRSRGQIVLTVASSGIASLLIPGGRTAHSRFAIPLNVDQFSTCNIRQGSQLAELIVKSKLIIWDEAPMVNKFCFEALDRTMRDLLKIVNSNSENLPFAVLKLTQNMRLKGSNNIEGSDQSLREFADWLLKIGDGKIGEISDGIGRIKIPDDILIKDWNNPVEAVVTSTFKNYIEDPDDEKNLQDRAVLAPTLQTVDEINEYMMKINQRQHVSYFSADMACKSETQTDVAAAVHTPEFLNGLKSSGLPNHEIKLKVGIPIMLLRNIDHSSGLCNGTRLIVTSAWEMNY